MCICVVLGCSQERVFGYDGAPTVGTVKNIAKLLKLRADPGGAEVMHRRALDSLLRTMGETHPLTLTELHDLGCLLHRMDRVREGEGLLRRAYLGRRHVLGAQHSNTLQAAQALAQTLLVVSEWKHEPDFAQKLQESEQLLRQVITGRTALFGANSIETAETESILADFYLFQTRYAEGETLYKHVYAVYSAEYGDADERSAAAAYGAGSCMQYLRRFTEAVGYFQHSHSGLTTLYSKQNKLPRHKQAIAESLEMLKYTMKRSKIVEVEPQSRGKTPDFNYHY